jgi:hypothetical protein
MADLWNSEVVQILKRLADLDEILYGGDAIQDDLYSTLLNLVALTIPKWRTFKLLRWVQRTPDNI